MSVIDSIQSLYKDDSRLGDQLINPQRWCLRQCRYLTSSLEKQYRGMRDLFVRIIVILPLTIATFCAFILGILGAGIKSFQSAPTQYSQETTLKTEEETTQKEVVSHRLLQKQPVYTIRIENTILYASLKSKLSTFSKDVLKKIKFHDNDHEIHFEYEFLVLKKFAAIYEVFGDIFGKTYSIFDGEPGPTPGITYLFAMNHFQQLATEMLHEGENYLKKAPLPPKPEIYVDGQIQRKKTSDRPQFFGHSRFFRGDPISNTSPEKLVNLILQNFDGIFIGERHDESAPKYFLCQHMALFVRLGVETLFMEGLSYGTKEELETYLSNPSAPIPLSIKACSDYAYLQWPIEKNTYMMEDVIIAAKAAGIKRVIGTESEITGFQDSRLRGEAVGRSIAMHYQAKLIIDQEKGKGKSLIYCGQTHMKRGCPTPSLSEIYGFPGIFVHEFSRYNSFTAPDFSVMPPMTELLSDYVNKNEEELGSYCDFRIGMSRPMKS